jgi:uncharacterized protein YggT (Ycf19 family)
MSQYERTTVDQSVTEVDTRPAGWVIAVRIVSLVFGILQALLALRIVLLVLGADRANSIVAAIINLTNPFVEPFRGMFRLDHIAAGSASVVDIAAIVALVGWTLVELLILAIIRLADRRTYAGA